MVDVGKVAPFDPPGEGEWDVRLRVSDFNECAPGQLTYITSDGTTKYIPGLGVWKADGKVPALVLTDMRTQMVIALQTIEDELERRGLLRRATTPPHAAA